MQRPSDHASDLLSRSAAGSGQDAPAAGRNRPLHATAAISPSSDLQPDLCVIGGGPGGLTVAAAAAQLGVSVVLAERHKMGGDCLNYGCIPSKTLLAAANRAHAMRTAGAFGISPVEPAIDRRALRDHIADVIAEIAPNDSIERFTGMNVVVIPAPAQFADRKTVLAGEYRIRARRFVIATGSSPAIPSIPGLETVPYFTNETIFGNAEHLGHLIVIGGGPAGLELGQAHLRLGSRVTVLEAAGALAGDDPEMSAVVLDRLRSEGLEIVEGAAAERVVREGREIVMHVTQNGVSRIVRGSHLLLAAGREPNLSGLNLEAAGIKWDAHGIRVNKALLTSNRRVYAIGDVTQGPRFTHVANYHADIVIRRAVFRLPAKVDPGLIPWTTFTDPELAHVGLTEAAARQRHGRIRVLRWPFYENDKAQVEHATDGFVKVVTDAKGRVLGASAVGRLAGEVIQMWCLAISQGLNIKAMTQWVSPYPSLSEINKRVAYGYYAGIAARPMVRKIIGWLARLG